VLDEGAFTDGSLDAAMLSPADYTFDDASSDLSLSFQVMNPAGRVTMYYLAFYDDNAWHVLKEIGVVGAGETETIGCPLEISYSGAAEENCRIAVVATTPGGYVGKEFNIEADWTPYEGSLKSVLLVVGGGISIFMLGALAIVAAGVLGVAAYTRHQEVGKGEYTLWSLFFPLMKARPLGEQIANIIISPFFWAIEGFFILLIGLIILLIAVGTISPDIGLLGFVIGGVAAIFMPFIYLVAAWLLDFYEREPLRFVFSMFLWGGMSTFVAFILNTTVDLITGLFLGSLSMLLVAVIVAPIVEETAKGLGLLIVSGHHELDDTFDGILYGFAIGLGFAAVENWLYFAANVNPASAGGLGPWAFNIFYRSLFCALAHGCFTGITGGVIGYMKSRPSLRNYAFLGFFLGVPFAMLLHGTFNFFAILDGVIEQFVGTPMGVFDPVLTIGVTGVYIVLGYLLQRGIRKRQLEEARVAPVIAQK
jgi:RsiW-degrading membrane proteinase PrsW (M82 family)